MTTQNTLQETETPTPRTDEACRAEHDGRPSQYVVADFARQLERENVELKQQLAEERTIGDLLAASMDGQYPPSKAIARYNNSLASISDAISGKVFAENTSLKQQLENERQFGLEMTLTIERKDAVISSLKQQLEKEREDTEALDWLSKHTLVTAALFNRCGVHATRPFEWVSTIPEQIKTLRQAIREARAT